MMGAIEWKFPTLLNIIKRGDKGPVYGTLGDTRNKEDSSTNHENYHNNDENSYEQLLYNQKENMELADDIKFTIDKVIWGLPTDCWVLLVASSLLQPPLWLVRILYFYSNFFFASVLSLWLFPKFLIVETWFYVILDVLVEIASFLLYDFLNL